MESAWFPGVGDLLLGASLGLNLLCLYLLWARLYAQPGAPAAPQPREGAPPLPPTAWPGKERGCRAGTKPDTEENEHCQLANSEESDYEDDDPPLEEFSAQMEEIKECIRSIRKIADDIDKTHKDCVIASITASSMGAVSETLNILGSTLTPRTASGSLILTAVALGFRVGETIISVSSSVYEKIVNSMKKEETQTLINQCKEALRTTKSPDELDLCSNLAMSNQKDIVKYLESAKECVPTIYNNVKEIRTNVKTLYRVRADPRLKALAKQATAASEETRANIAEFKEVDEKCAGTILAKSKNERLCSLGLAACELLVKAKAIFQCCQHLSEGAQTEMAVEIRAKARKFEEALEKLTEGEKQPGKKFCRKNSRKLC